jgi:hypothetical protein
VHYGWKKPLRLAACAVPIVIVAHFVALPSLLGQLAAAVTGCGLFAILVWWQVLEPSDRELALRSLRRPGEALRLFTA